MAYESWYTGKSVDKGLWPYVEVTSGSSAGVWTGTIGNPDPGDADEGTDSSKFALETGLKVLVRLTVAAGASTTTFNLNGTGSKTVYYRWTSATDKINLTSNHFAIGSVIPLVYKSDANGWVLSNSAPKSTQSATPSLSASASGTSVTLNAHNHGITDSKHSHSFTPSGSVGVGTESASTASSKAGISASSSAPAFTGTSHGHTFTGASHSHTFTGTAHNHGITDNKHTHKYDKVTSAAFSGTKVTSEGSAAGTTINWESTDPSTSSVAVTTAKVTNPSITITDSKHSHSFTPSGSVGVGTESGTTAATTGFTTVFNSATYDSSTQTLTFGTTSVASSGHTHTYTKPTGSGTFTGTAGTTGSSSAGISASASGTAVTLNEHSHTYKKISSVSVNSHTHGVTAAGSISLTYNNGGEQVTTIGTDKIAYVSSSATGVSINNATAGGSISSTTASGSISSTTAGGSISAPTITITDNGHTHAYTKPTGSGTFTGTAGTTGSSATGVSVNNATVTTASITNPTITISGGAHTHEIK